jgi:hypothetical protein
MASTYTEGLVIELIGSGDKAGSWGDVTNSNLQALNQGITGFSEVDLSGASSPHLIDLSDAQAPDESTSPSRSSIIKFINVPDTPTPFLINFQVNSAPAQRVNCVVINGDDNNTISVGTGANGDRLTILNGYAANVYSEVNSGNSSYFDIKNSLANLSVDKIALENNEIIGNATDDKITIGASTLEVGDGAGVVIIKSDDNDLIFKTDNTGNNRIRINHGSDDDINVNFDGTGSFNVGGDITTTSAGSSAGSITAVGGFTASSGGLTVTAGGIDVTAGGLDLNSTGITDAGTISGATLSSANISGATISGSTITTSSVSATSVTSSGNISTTGTGSITTANGLTVTAGGIDVDGGSLDLANGGINNPGTITMGSGVISGGTISSSTINNTPIGAGTPSNGAFTTLSAANTSTLANVNSSGTITANTIDSPDIRNGNGAMNIQTTGNYPVNITASSNSVTITSAVSGANNLYGGLLKVANTSAASIEGTIRVGSGTGDGFVRVGGDGNGTTGSSAVVYLGNQETTGSSSTESGRLLAPMLSTETNDGSITGIYLYGRKDASLGQRILYNASTTGSGNSENHQFYVGNSITNNDNIKVLIDTTGLRLYGTDDSSAGGRYLNMSTTSGASGVGLRRTSSGGMEIAFTPGTWGVPVLTSGGDLSVTGDLDVGGKIVAGIDSTLGGSNYVSAQGGLRSSLFTSRTVNQNIDIQPNGSGRLILRSDSTSSNQGTEAININASAGRIGLQVGNSSDRVSIRVPVSSASTTPVLQAMFNEEGLLLHEAGGQYLNFTSNIGSSGNGLRANGNSAIEFRARLTATEDNWGRIYHSGMVSGDGAYFENLSAGTPTGGLSSNGGTGAQVVTTAHSLTTLPRHVRISLRYVGTGTDVGYSPNDEFYLSAGDPQYAIHYAVDSTNVTILVPSEWQRTILNKGTAALVGATWTSWRFAIRAWK